MNISTLRKNYDKLTIKERFAALAAANAREDATERAALLQTAPRKHFSVPDTWGLSEAFKFLSMWHVMNQLGYAATFYFLFLLDEVPEVVTIDNKEFGFDDVFIILQRRILEGREAWRTICKEYGLEPEAMLEGLPYVEVIEMAELIVTAANHDNPLDLPDLEKTINTWREAIEMKSKEWE